MAVAFATPNFKMRAHFVPSTFAAVMCLGCPAFDTSGTAINSDTSVSSDPHGSTTEPSGTTWGTVSSTSASTSGMEGASTEGASDTTLSPTSESGDANACAGHEWTPGEFQSSIEVAGTWRKFMIYVPESAVPTAPVPLVLVFHGFTMSGEHMAELTDWKAIAEREGFVVVFADGAVGLQGMYSAPWNVGADVCGAGVFAAAPDEQDDFAFVQAILARVGDGLCIDEDRVYASGFSMGAYFTQHLACNGPSRSTGGSVVRAIAAHSGGTYAGPCKHPRVPVMLLHGTGDTLIRSSCTEEARVHWVERNGCGSGVDIEPVSGGRCEWQQSCPSDGAVVTCLFDGMNHGWAGAEYTGSWLLLQYGGGTQYENAAELSWSFFVNHT